MSYLDLFFIQENGFRFKARIHKTCYFLVIPKKNRITEVEEFLTRKFSTIKQISRLEKENLNLVNHLAGEKTVCLQLGFNSIKEMNDVKRILSPAIKKNISNLEAENAYQQYEYNICD
jgi:DNA polymerase epsilon subunit 1